MTDHYGSTDLIDRVDGALRDAGSTGPLTPQELAPLDQFHAGGIAATAELAARLAPANGTDVLDVGSGIGGSSRYLAATFGCRVTGIDLNRPFVDLATMLTERTGQAESVHFIHGDACALPFADASFDAAWTQHVAMNIADRDALYTGIFRVLRPGSRFAIYDILAGNGEPLQYPLPWATDASTSFLLGEDATKNVLQASGFEIETWEDVSPKAFAWTQAQQAAVTQAPPERRGFALPLIMGSGFPAMAQNIGVNALAGRLKVVMAIVRRPS